MIGIAVVATNAYFLLGIRFIKRFAHFYKGSRPFKFYFFSDEDPTDYLPEGIEVKWFKRGHDNWQDATNSKFSNILSAKSYLLSELEYLYYFDADTNISKPFTEDWMLGNIVGGEHYLNKEMGDKKNYDRNPESKAYIPEDTNIYQMYFYGAFFGGKVQSVLNMCRTLYNNQLKDKEIGYEPAVNDESYINNYFHYQPPKMVATEDFEFEISCKGGLNDIRHIEHIDYYKQELKRLKNNLFNIANGKVIADE